jgi:hypothetical protein
MSDRLLNFNRAILFTLQWGYESHSPIDEFKGIITNGILHNQIIEAIERTEKDVIWLIKTHPMQMHDKYILEHLIKLQKRYSNIEYISGPELSMLSLLEHPLVQGHITMSSQSCYDSAICGIPSLVLCPTVKFGGVYFGMFKDLIDKNMVNIGELDNDDIIDWVMTAEKKNSVDINSPETVEIEEFIKTLL